MKKIIGIPGYTGRESNNFGVANTYLELVSKFGNPRIIMPWEDKVEVDLLLLPGGLDTSPTHYGQTPSFKASNQDVFKEHFFTNKLKLYIDNTPILGICLGAQMLAAYFGCKLVQDLIYHEQSSSRWSTAHKVYTHLEDIDRVAKKEKTTGNVFSVNSHHHQALTLNNVNEVELLPLLYAKNNDTRITGDGPIIEAFRHKHLPIVGVQHHPEELYDSFTLRIFRHLLDIENVPSTRMA